MNNSVILAIESQIKNLAKEAFKNVNKDSITLEEFIQSFENMCSVETEPKETLKKEKKKREAKVVPDNERCIALKKDKGRCAARAYVKGKNPKVCTLHNNKGCNYGISEEAPREMLEEEKDLFGESSDDEEVF